MNFDDSITGGYVILSRSMLFSELWQCSGSTIKVAMYLLFSAKYEDDPRRGLKRGQCRKSYGIVSDDCEISFKVARTSMDTLKKLDFIECEHHPRGARFGQIITIVNYEKYQRPDNYVAPQTKPQPEKEPVKQIKQPKEKKASTADNPKDRIKFNRDLLKFEGITNADIQRWKEAYPAVIISVEIKKVVEWIIGAGAKGHKSNWYAFLNNWWRRCQDQGGTRTGAGLNVIGGGSSDNWQKRELEEAKKRIAEDKRNGIV